MSLPSRLHVEPAAAAEHLQECPGCGLFQRLPELPPGRLARCPRCRCRLERNSTDTTILMPLALAVSSAVFYLLAVAQPLMSFDVYGRSRSISLVTGPLELVREGWGPVGALVVLATAVFPLLAIVLVLAVTISVARGTFSASRAWLLRWYGRLRPWSMVEVYILGVLVAYSKLIDLAQVGMDYGFYALVGLTITMAATDATIRVDVIWRSVRPRGPGGSGPDAGPAARPPPGGVRPGGMPLGGMPPGGMPPGGMVACTACGLVCTHARPLRTEDAAVPCPRCGQALRRRKPDSLRRTLALLIAATTLYIPANLFPIMTIVKLYRGGGHTILGGVRELFESGMLPLALLVFFASVTVPVLKILSLSVMILGTWRRSATCLVDRSKLYWVVDFIGRWSMIDVFMVSILVGLVQLNALGSITANAGVEAFAAVVVLTIFAAGAFDPRVMWDAAGLNGAAQPALRLQGGPDRAPVPASGGAKAATA